MAVDVSMTRKRSSASCESGQSTMTEGLGASAALSSAIADMILKKGLSHTLSEDPNCSETAQFTTELSEMPLHRLFTREEAEFNLGLDKYGVVRDMGADDSIVFKCFEEDWEEVARTNKKGTNEFRLLQKYKEVRFYDEDEDQIYEICPSNLEWVKKLKGDATTPCYMVLAKPVKDGDEEGDDEVELEGYRINSALYGMIEDPRSGHPENFKIETKDDREPGAQ